jgi:hypothetical protein
MKDAIILHSVHDKTSREFVVAYGNRNDVTVLEDDGYNIRLKYPYISGFPTIIINTPSYVDSSITEESGGVFITLDINVDDLVIPASIEYINCPKNWDDVQQRIDYWESKVPNWKQTDSRYV